jgi:hypothetical protein
MTARIFILATAILALAAPFAAAAREQEVSAEAVMTLRSLGNGSWRLDIQNMTTTPVTITQVTWTAPDGLTVDRIKKSVDGTCQLSGGGFQCRTQLAPPSCGTCPGGDLTVDFRGTGLEATWVPTSYGGYWVQHALTTGHATLVGAAARAQI